MALLFTTPLFCPTSSLSSTSAPVAHPFFGLNNKLIAKHRKPSVGYTIRAPLVKSRGALIVKASSDDGTGANALDSPTPANTKETVPGQNLPLESKIQMNLEQKMKIAKKIRLRRKRLLRKRHLRKMGRWPPSKLKKNKTV